MSKCECKDNVHELVAKVYTDHCTDSTDSVVVKALVETLARYAAVPEQQVSTAYCNK
jgi:hypothetical protein